MFLKDVLAFLFTSTSVKTAWGERKLLIKFGLNNVLESKPWLGMKGVQMALGNACLTRKLVTSMELGQQISMFYPSVGDSDRNEAKASASVCSDNMKCDFARERKDQGMGGNRKGLRGSKETDTILCCGLQRWPVIPGGNNLIVIVYSLKRCFSHKSVHILQQIRSA